MKLKLIAVAGIGLLAGACSLRPPSAAGVYSSLPSEEAPSRPAHRTAASHNAAVASSSGFGAVTVAPSPRMPGDLTAPIAEPRGAGINPVASLTASAQARTRWESLKPGNLSRPPLLQSRLALAIGVMTAGDINTGSVPSSNPAKGEKPARTAKADNYDREATMQHLIDGGRAASRNICEGC